MDLGAMAKKVRPPPLLRINQAQFISPEMASIWDAISLLTGFIIWAWCLIWIVLAFTALIMTLRHGKIPFNLGWWAFTFPLGTLV
jgi:tellurite resistance protein TehA-like permease